MYSFKNVRKENMKKIIKKYGMFISLMYASDNLQDYETSILKVKEFPSNNQIETNHVILVDGYGVEDGKELFFVRNSWVFKWGYERHFKISVDKLCGIGGDDKGKITVNFIPIVELAGSETKGTYSEVWMDVRISGTGSVFIVLIALLFLLF